ncbi:MAG: hypothetical protein H6703_16955 [Myxococcales bacterium]|nr:hypothetical protein [Myxococcales bacterium]MCB9553305.1 hypothetical protein [Myxococcales bacterium]
MLRFNRTASTLAVALVLLAGCDDPEVLVTPDGAAPQLDGDVIVDAENLTPDAAPIGEDNNCGAYDYRGTTYDCEALDRCNEADFQYRLACCECDPRYCEPDPGACDPPPEPGEPEPEAPIPQNAESCMACHNGAQANDYSGNGIGNPHPFAPAQYVPCTGCHGGNGRGAGKNGSHVPAPPEIGDRIFQANNNKAFFNRVTLAGVDKLTPDPYTGPNGQQYSNLDYLQFINPGDLRVVSAGRGCGQQGCHYDEHAQWVPRSMIATSTGIFSATRFLVGVDNRIPEYRGNRDANSLADSAPRTVQNPAFDAASARVGEIGRLVEQPELAAYNGQMRDNGNYLAANLNNHIINANQDQQKPNRVRAGSPLETLIDEQVSITCGDCHLYSAGANNRYADFRSSGCTACHMEYSYDGRHAGFDPNVPRDEPANPDAIAAGERAHVLSHQIRNVAKILPNGAFVRGISDRACVGCHQGSNRTVLQFWGIRLDQNQDLVNNFQYPANPDDFENTAQDQRLYNPAVANNTFNGRNANQYILTEDYDADGRDDTPPDIHYERGLGCIDCHGSRDLHGGTAGDATSGQVVSRMNQATALTCENCHGTVEGFARTVPCTTYSGQAAECTTDKNGNPMKHVTKDPQGHYWLISRVDGQRHYLPQTKDVTILSQRTHPITLNNLYSPKASYAMGRADGNPQTGTGPLQANPNLYTEGFSHLDTMDCQSCHASWINNCIGCHLANAYDVNPANYFFSNITGERILLNQTAADFVYQNPVNQYLGVNSRGKITKVYAGQKVFWRFVDLNGDTSDVFVFSDRLGEGNNPALGGRNDFPANAMNQLMPHSIRGAVDGQNEGPSYCVACHLNDAMIANADLMAQYDAFVAAYDNQDFANLDFNVLAANIGQNTGNQNNSPFFVRMMSGMGTGTYLFDANGCPVNPLDNNANRQNCNGVAPAVNFADQVNNVAYDLDRMVEFNGIPNSSNAHPRETLQGAQRGGATNSQMGGPLGSAQLQRLVGGDNIYNGLILDAWFDADGNAQGQAANLLQ